MVRRYAIHGLVLAADWPLPMASVDADHVDVGFEVDLAAVVPTTPTASRADDPDEPSVVEHWHDDRLVVEFPEWATFEMTRTTVRLIDDQTDDVDLISHLLLDAVVPRLVALRGDVMLHAAGVVAPSGRAHLVVGATGAGKSTLATALATRGWPLLDDDGIRVVAATAGEGFVAFPGYAGVRLLPDAADAVLPGAAPGTAMAAGHDKQRFDVVATRLAMATTPAPVAAIHVIEATGAPLAIERCGLAEALGLLTEHGYHLADEPETLTRLAFERSAALAAAVPVYRLGRPRGLDRLDEVCSLLDRLDARGDAAHAR